jgi:ribosomal-protein-alanine N-acetyltransferase
VAAGLEPTSRRLARKVAGSDRPQGDRQGGADQLSDSISGRVVIAPARPSDCAELVEANQASRDHHLPWVEPFTDTSGFDVWLARMQTGSHVGLVARDAERGRVVGIVNLSEIVQGVFQCAYLGYYGMAWYAGSGTMTEAVRLTVAYAFGELGLHRLEANIQPNNSRSIALVRRLGFRQEGYSPRYLCIGGVWRDHERWALLSNE